MNAFREVCFKFELKLKQFSASIEHLVQSISGLKHFKTIWRCEIHDNRVVKICRSCEIYNFYFFTDSYNSRKMNNIVNAIINSKQILGKVNF